MTLNELASKIPYKYRKQLLDGNVIYKAIADANDVQMRILIIIYENYVFPEGEKIDLKSPCLICLNNILNQFKNLEQYLVILERESKLLDSI